MRCIILKTEEKVRILLADKDSIYMKRMKHCLERRKNVQVVGMADNGDAAISLLASTNPDVLLLDVLLSGRDGLWVLEQLHQRGQNNVLSIVISAMNNDRIVSKTMTLGCDYFMAKPIQGDALIERIESLTDSIIKPSNFEETHELPKELTPPVSLEHDNYEASISTILNRMGISASIKGYHYIRKAILMAMDDEEVLIGITKGLYPDIAKSYKTTASKVERAIRHAIECCWKKNGKEVFLELSGYYSKDKPTNGQFIASLSEYFRLHITKNNIKSA